MKFAALLAVALMLAALMPSLFQSSHAAEFSARDPGGSARIDAEFAWDNGLRFMGDSSVSPLADDDDSDDDDNDVTILNAGIDPTIFSPDVSPASLSALVNIREACEFEDDETCVLRYAFSINSATETVRVVAGEIEVTDPERDDDDDDDDDGSQAVQVLISESFDGRD